MYRVSTFDFCKTLESRVKEKDDDVLSCRAEDFSKLMALKARYHSQCHKNISRNLSPHLPQVVLMIQHLMILFQKSNQNSKMEQFLI